MTKTDYYGLIEKVREEEKSRILALIDALLVEKKLALENDDKEGFVAIWCMINLLESLRTKITGEKK